MSTKKDEVAHVETGHSVSLADIEPPAVWAPGMKKLYFFFFFCFWASTMNGYDGTLMGSVYAMSQFTDHWRIERESTGMSTMMVLYKVGSWVAAFIAGPVSDKWGRRFGMASGSAVVAVGTVLMALADNNKSSGYGIMLVGRFFAGFGVNIACASAPSYVVELAPPQYRGTIGGAYNTFWFVGFIIASWVSYGTQKLAGDVAWRVPLWTQMVPSVFIIAGVFMMPESPRWLVANGRNEEARAILAKYHAEGNTDAPLVDFQYQEMVSSITTDGSDKRFWDYSGLFKNHNSRYRFLMVFIVAFCGQMSGSAIFSYFSATIMDAAGIGSQDTQLLINGVKAVIQFLCAILIGARLTDKVGRRKMLITGTGLFCIWLSCVAIGVAQVENGVGPLAIFGIFAFDITNAISWTPMQALYAVECLDNQTRVKGMGISGLITYLALAVNDYAVPLGIKAIGYRFFIIYIIWDFLETVFFYFFLVETKGLTLEELDEVFDAPNPSKASLEKVAALQNRA